MEKSILVAIDGSPYSSNSLEYLHQTFGTEAPPELHLISVVPAGSGGLEWMYDVDPLRKESPLTQKRTALANRYLKDAKNRLMRKGYPEDKIHLRTETATSGVASTLHREADKGNYDAILVGRRGVGAFGGMLFGSTSAELITQCHTVPIWVIDGEVTSKRFLLAVHTQPQSLVAADHLAFILGNHPQMEILLYHSNTVFGRQKSVKAEEFHTQWGKEWCDKYLDIENFLFYAHAQVLMDGGIARHRIIQLPAQMHIDVGADLLKQAKKNNCGTLVLGRGPRTERRLLKGASDKTLQQAQNIAVWLVG
ncbi:MAG: hypothetical protein CSA31_02730 [Desulfobulbus propionicus]|nr:MAG: hypothetical protein CSA31_02730 [Desulfobulbus propionicus]